MAEDAAMTDVAEVTVAASKRSVFSEDLLRMYYARLFPYAPMFKWLSYGNDPAVKSSSPLAQPDYFHRREFSFTIANDIYIRYLSFKNQAEFEREIQRRQPHKIDIGAVYSFPAKDHNTVKASAFKPLERELVFDIDLTDYDEVRTGCTPKDMWARGSWRYMSLAVKVCDAALREDFGFENLLWVFSGRRGVHCWVCDASARTLTDQERTAVVNYLTLVTGNENTANRCAVTTPLHPALARALPMCSKVFEEMVLPEAGQGLLADEQRWERVLKMLPEESGVAERLRSAWKEDVERGEGDSCTRWRQLKATADSVAKKFRKQDRRKHADDLDRAVVEIIVLHTYPRLDVNVSTHRNHLLKSPFVIHPKTGKVCVPILDVASCDNFDPDGVPTLVTLLNEIDDYDSRVKAESADANPETNKRRKVPDAEKTALKSYIDGFERGFLKKLYASVREANRDAAQRVAANTGEW